MENYMTTLIHIQGNETTLTLEHTCESSFLGDVPRFKTLVLPTLSSRKADISLVTANKNKDSFHIVTEIYFILAWSFWYTDPVIGAEKEKKKKSLESYNKQRTENDNDDDDDGGDDDGYDDDDDDDDEQGKEE